MPDDLEEKLEKLKLENDLLEQKLTREQREGLIREVKQKYGRNWRNILGLRKKSEGGLSIWEQLAAMRIKTEIEGASPARKKIRGL